MSKLSLCTAIILLGFLLDNGDATAATGPFALLHSLFNPSTNAQAWAGQGSSVAIDGNTVVVGASADHVGAESAGMAKVYDASTGALLHTLTNPSPARYDYFGRAVAISGKRVVVGAYWDDTRATQSGIAYVYDLAAAVPTLPVATLSSPSQESYVYFGSAVAISETTVVVGAPGLYTGAGNSGGAYVFDVANPASGVPMTTLPNPSPAQGDLFGSSVAISGSRVAVGSPFDDTGAPSAGSVYLYNLASGSPTVPSLTLTNPTPDESDRFGDSVSISGGRVVVGAPFDNTWAFDAGSAYVYDLANATPTVPVATLNNPSPEAYDYFGSSVSISGTRVVVGALYDDVQGANAGSAYVYQLNTVAPTVPVTTLYGANPAAGDLFGASVSISEARVVSGAPSRNVGAVGAGSAYVFDLAGATPTVPSATLNHPSPAGYSQFGFTTAISGTTVVVGAPLDDTEAINAGRAYLYDFSSGAPAPVAVLSNPSPAEGDRFGTFVSISGMWVVVGAKNDDSGASDAGSVYVYNLASAAPTVPVLTLTNPIPAVQDFFGDSVAIDGTRVVVGAPYNDTGTNNAGSAFVYDLASALPTVPVLTLTNPIPAEQERFGWSVAISGNRIVIGADADDTGADDAGSAYVYDLTSASPAIPVLTLTNPTPARFDGFGVAVAISGTRVVVGANQDDTGDLNAGIAYVYDLTSPSPAVPTLTLTNPTPVTYETFANSVAISGTLVVVGTPYDRTSALDAGNACVFDLASANPTVPIATLSKRGPAAGDGFGWSVAIDGTTVVAGAPFDDWIATDRGAAYVFGLVPTLQIAPVAPELATLSWTPATSSGFALQHADVLAPTNWLNAPSGETNPVTLSLTNGARFYRLRGP